LVWGNICDDTAVAFAVAAFAAFAAVASLCRRDLSPKLRTHASSLAERSILFLGLKKMVFPLIIFFFFTK
jgi:hypothetical protein